MPKAPSDYCVVDATTNVAVSSATYTARGAKNAATRHNNRDDVGTKWEAKPLTEAIQPQPELPLSEDK